MKIRFVYFLIIALAFLNVFAFCFEIKNGVVFAEEETQIPSDDIEKQIDDNVSKQLGSFDFDNLDDVLFNLKNTGVDLFFGQTFWQKVNSVIDGDFQNGYATYLDAILGVVFKDVLNFIPILATIVAITVLCSLVGNLKGKFSSESIQEIVEFVVFGVVVVIVSSIVIELFKSSSALLGSISGQMEIIFPILLTMLASIGGTVTVGIFQPAIAVLSTLTVKVFNAVIMPLLIFLFAFVVVSHISKNIKFDKLIGFFKSALKWFSSICFAIFMFVLVVQGIVAGSFDGVSIKAMKFALKNYVPVLGGYLSEGFNVAMASSMLIKNAVGLSGLLLLFATVLGPVVKIIVVILGLKLTAGILQPISNTKVHGFLSSVADILKLLIMVLLGIIFMYLISVGLLMCSSNIL